MTELELQRELIADAVAAGCHAFKASHRFMVGVPDIFAQTPDLPATWIEVKFVRGMPSSTGFVTLALTPKQRQFIMRNQSAGGRSGWLLAVQLDRRGNYALACGTDPKVKRVRMNGDDILTRLRGSRWPIMEVIRRIACGCP